MSATGLKKAAVFSKKGVDLSQVGSTVSPFVLVQFGSAAPQKYAAANAKPTRSRVQ
jgi:hypothetical protein